MTDKQEPSQIADLEHERGIASALSANCERHGVPYFECVEAEDVDAIVNAYLTGRGLSLSLLALSHIGGDVQ